MPDTVNCPVCQTVLNSLRSEPFSNETVTFEGGGSFFPYHNDGVLLFWPVNCSADEAEYTLSCVHNGKVHRLVHVRESYGLAI